MNRNRTNQNLYEPECRSEGCARTGYFIPVRDGMEAGEVWNFFRRRRRRRRRPPQKVLKKWLFSKHQILRFVTHSRALNVLAAAYCREFRRGSFMFSKYKSKSENWPILTFSYFNMSIKYNIIYNSLSNLAKLIGNSSLRNKFIK